MFKFKLTFIYSDGGGTFGRTIIEASCELSAEAVGHAIASTSENRIELITVEAL